MADVEAGWYADPWRQAPLRWWDGEDWTGHVSDPLPPPPTGGVLSTLMPGGGRIAVVDVETTGLYNVDRVLEVGIITLDENGRVLDRFETLINPSRDVGPTWLHGISASMIAEAPPFDDVATEIAARLDGAVVCAHNLPFDARMLGNELDRCSIDFDWGRGLDTLRVTGCKLAVACDEAGIALEGAHSALGDADAVSNLLVRYAQAFQAVPIAARVGPYSVRPTRLHTRRGMARAIEETPFVASLMQGARSEPDVAPYVQLLDMALADLRLTHDERSELDSLAMSLGIDASLRVRAHRDLVGQMSDAAVDDHIVTEEEYDQLCRAAALLEVDIDVVDRRTDGLRSLADTLTVSPGMTVCFTGAAVDEYGDEIPRSRLQRLASESGLMPVNSVTASACQLLVAADPGSRSGKAAKARRFGIPVASVDDFLVALGTGALPIARLSTAGVALVCSECGASWLASERSSKPTCADCREVAQPTTRRSATPPPSASEVQQRTVPASVSVETLICVVCGASWERQRTRGRKPSRCSDCR